MGIVASPDGTLYVGETMSQTIAVVDLKNPQSHPANHSARKPNGSNDGSRR